ncbi:Imm51 family immunity protein [Nonomuraea sp. NPDC050786]|uniref:Imm51 family immunity protein n=1 Tax=Nonomuraea sp. NPDC050786 TaxID=3154840 RepID=UPI0033C3D955
MVSIQHGLDGRGREVGRVFGEQGERRPFPVGFTSPPRGLEARFQSDSEAGMFWAYGDDQKALQDLAELMSAVATDGDRVRGLIAAAEAAGFDFDD